MPNAFTLFGEIKVDTKQFTGALARAETQLKGTTAAMTKAEMAATKTGTATGGMGPKFLLAAAAATAAASGIYGLMKKTSDFGSKIFDASQKTGLSTETLSALKFAAEQSGASFEQATKGVTRFSILMGEAASGSEKAAAKLKDLNVSSTDLTTGFTQAILAIAQMPPGIEQTMAASDAFGKKLGADLIPMIQSFDGNLPGLMDKLKGTGILMSTEAAQASDKFGDALKRLEDQVGAIGRSFALALMPQISEAMEQVAAELGKERPNYQAAGVKIGESVGSGIGTGLSKAIENLPRLLTPPTGEVTPIYLAFGKGLTKALITGIGSIDGKAVWNQMANSWVVTLTTLGPRLFVIGQQAVQGFVNGVISKIQDAEGSIRAMAAGVIAAAQGVLQIHSPSKVFFNIGKDVAQGFIDGISAMKASTSAAMAKLLDVTGIKGLGKKDASGVELLTSLIHDLAKLNVVSREQEVRMEMTAGKYEKLNKAVQSRIILAAQELDKIDALAKSQEHLNDIFNEYITKALPEKSNVEQLNEALAGPDVQLALGKMGDRLRGIVTTMAEINAINKDFQDNPVDLGQGSGVGIATGGPTELGTGTSPAADDYLAAPRLSWENFWEMMKFRMEEFRQSLPSMKEAIGENLIGGIMELGNVFGSAINDWIANGENFFKAIAKGFRQMVANIIGELVRLMVFQLLMKIIGVGASAAGAGAGAHGASIGGGQAPFGGFADGGMIAGRGTSTSDSILARLSNGEFVMKAAAVKKWGVDTLSSMNSGMMPAFAGGGLVGSSSSVTTNAPVYNINISGGGNQDTVRSVKQGIREATRMQQREAWRGK